MEYKLEPIGDSLYIKGRIGWKGLKKSEYLESGEYRIINGKALTSNGIDWNECGFISKERYEESPEIMLETNDIVITKDGTIGKVDIIKSLDKPTTVASGLFVLRNSNPEEFNTMFIYYFLKSPIFKQFIEVRKEGSVIPHLYQKDFVELEIPKFNINNQKLIANILCSIDNKIDNNKQIIKNLEELSQTLFKHWFVDFEFPDEDGNPYKSSGGEMIDSELGEIPPDWKVGVLSDMTEIIMGQSPKSDTYNNNKVGLPLLNGASDFKNRNIKPTKYTSAPKKIGHNLDYVFGVRATIGLVTELDGEYAIGRGAGLSKNNEENREFIYEILNQAFTYFERIGSGSVYINISSKDLKQYKLIIPSKQVLMKYHYQLEPIFSELHNRKEQITSLTNLRDTLLPKLMSGELEIPDDIEVNIDEFSI